MAPVSFHFSPYENFTIVPRVTVQENRRVRFPRADIISRNRVESMRSVFFFPPFFLFHERIEYYAFIGARVSVHDSEIYHISRACVH